MKYLVAFLLIALALSARAEFEAIDIVVDSKSEPLAAYQIEFSSGNKAIRIVGIEGGGHEAFKTPPLYDPKAMQRERVILGAFSTATNLPTGKTRVATIHVQRTGQERPAYRLAVSAAANAEGLSIPVTATLNKRRDQ